MIRPSDVRYIKLGPSGCWVRQSFDEQYVPFGYHEIPHEICDRGSWNEVRPLLADRASEGAITAGVTEVETFYKMGQTCLWVTFAEGYLWWTFARNDVEWLGEDPTFPSRFRRTIGGWSNKDIKGNPLRVASLSSNLTKTANFRATICKIPAEEYLLRRIYCEEEPVVARAREARERMIEVAVDMIRSLHWKDFEQLADLIFARSGWQRVSRLGGDLTDIDFALESPSVSERAFVQVKSKADQSVLDEYLKRYRISGYDRFFFVCHSPKGNLSLPIERGLHLFEGVNLAETAVKNGLFDWLVERTG